MRLLPIALSFLLLSLSPAFAKAARWTATSSTAMAITGDIAVAADSITFGNGASIGIKQAAPDRPDVFIIDPPSNPVLLQGNGLCGDQPPTFLTLYRDGGSLALSVFDGPDMPPSPAGALDTPPGLCATYHYEQ
jgi:hypothetical protein